MADNRGMDADPGWINRKFQELERKIEGLRSERRSRATTITDGDLIIRGGGKLVVDGGDFLLLDTDGSTVFRLGPQQWDDRGVSIFRETGEVALAVRKVFENSPDQTLELRDRFNNYLVAEEALGSGLARPFLDISLQPVLATPGPVNSGPWGWEVPCAETDWTTVHQAWFARSNQYGRLRFRIAASDATTACEVRVTNAADGLPLTPFLSPAWTGVRAAGPTDYVEVMSPALGLPGVPWASSSIQVQVRVTAGTGTITVAVPEAHGA